MKKKLLISLIACLMLLSMATGAYGATKLQEIKAFLNPSLLFKVNGVPTQFSDAAGKNLSPISYNNTTYLPVRAVSDALGVAVDFEQATNTIHIGEKVNGTAISKGFEDMYYTKDAKFTTYLGKNYIEAYYNNGTARREAGFMLYPKKQYQTLSLQIAAINEPLTNVTVRDADHNIVLKTVETINPGDNLVTIDVNIGGVNNLYVFASVEKGGEVFVPLTASYFK